MPEPPADIYLDLRSRALGWQKAEHQQDIRGVITDLAYDEGLVTIVCLADDSTSMYTSRGGGIIGAGEYDHVAAANRNLLKVCSGVEFRTRAVADPPLPLSGQVRFTALASDGLRTELVHDEDLLELTHPFAGVYFAVQDVVTEMSRIEGEAGPRLLSEADRPADGC